MTDRALLIPPAALEDPRATELIRVWAAQDGQHVAISSDAWSDAHTWGVVLADLANHVANMIHEQSQTPRKRVIDELEKGFQGELRDPINDPTGSLSVDSPEN
ncbi:MAG: DUF5076 domain-containing protein [Planctomycetota bacterium]